MKMTAVRDLWMVPVSLRSAWDIRRACPPDLCFAHRAFEFGLGDKGGHGVDDHEVHRAGTDQHVGDFKGLLSVVGLRDEQFVGFDAKAPGIGHVKRVLGVDEGGGPAELLAFRDDVQGEGRFARGFGAVDFGDPALGDAADAEGEVYADGPGGDHRDFDMDIIGKLHHGALAEFAFDGFEGCFQRLLARFFRGKGWLFCHWGRLHKGRRGLPG